MYNNFLLSIINKKKGINKEKLVQHLREIEQQVWQIIRHAYNCPYPKRINYAFQEIYREDNQPK